MHDSTLPQKLNGLAGGQPEPAGRHRALQRAVNRAADAAMRCQNRVAAANAALRALRAEFLWRFELLRSRRQQPTLIDPEPLSLVKQVTEEPMTPQRLDMLAPPEASFAVSCSHALVEVNIALIDPDPDNHRGSDPAGDGRDSPRAGTIVEPLK
jgi:hypothetical protein